MPAPISMSDSRHDMPTRYTSVSAVHPSKVWSPIVWTLSGMDMLVKPVQPEKEDEPIFSTPAVSSTLSSAVQPRNAPSPIRVTDGGVVLGSEMLSSAVQ